jgi:hypothetical protein
VGELRAPALLQAQYTIPVGLNRTLFENARIGFSDIRKLFGEGGRLLDPHEWDDDTAAAVASIERVALFGKGKDGLGQIGYTTKVTLWNKGDALDKLMRNLGGYKPDKDQQKDILGNLPFEKRKRWSASSVALLSDELWPSELPLKAQSDLLALVRGKIERSKIFTFYPDQGPLRRQLYPKHPPFFPWASDRGIRAFSRPRRQKCNEAPEGLQFF